MDKVFPNQKIAGVDANKTSTIEIKIPEKINLKSNTENYVLSLSDIDTSVDIDKSIQKAYNFTRTGNYLLDLQRRIELLYKTHDTGLVININQEKLDNLIFKITKKINVNPIYPFLKVVKGKITIEKGKAGFFVRDDVLKATIGYNLSMNINNDIQIPIEKIDPSITEMEAATLENNALKLITKKMILNLSYENFVFDDNDLIKVLGIKEKYNIRELEKIAIEIGKKINSEPQSPKLEFKDGRVIEFAPSKDGIKLDYPKFKDIFIKSLDELINNDKKEINIEIPIIKTPPNITTDKINNLGIKELIGRGYSEFKGSIPSRIYNVNLAASKMDGVLIPPEETFSFNKTLGDVSRFTGYQPAYVIREGKTVLGDGGGVCQVSSTLFRAILNAGLPIVERKAHAYRVGYYEQKSEPGFDATVYAPSPDLKFTNDTPGNILIQTIVDLKKPSLTFELYGTSDGRVSKVSKPTITNQINPGPDIYQDDPNLPAGKIIQTEHKAYGATVKFNYQVTRNGEELINQTFTSVYRPWPAVYLKGI